MVNGQVIIPGLDLSAWKADLSEIETVAQSAIVKAFDDAQKVDYIDKIATSLGEAWENADGAGGAIVKLLDDLNKPANGGVLSKEAQAALDKLKAEGQSVFDATRTAAEKYAIATARYAARPSARPTGGRHAVLRRAPAL